MQVEIFNLVTAQDVELKLCLNVMRPFWHVFILRCLRLCLPGSCVLQKSVQFVTQHLGSQMCSWLPLLSSGHTHLLPEVQWSGWHNFLTRWLGLHVSLAPLGDPARQRRRSHSSHIVCVSAHCACLHYQHNQSLLFFFLLCFCHNVYSHLSASSAMAAGVSILSDLPYSTSGAHSGDNGTEMETGRRALQHTDTHEESCWVVFYTLS